MNVRVGLTVALVVALLAGAGPIATAAADDPGDGAFAIQQEGLDADEVRMDVAVRADGTAEWTLEFWVRLDDAERTAAFESIRAEIEDDPDGHVATFADRMDGTVAAASEATGREMAADGYAVAAERQSFAREYGVLRYTFDWHEFAAVEDGNLRAGDAIEGLYLDEGTRLLLSWPADYEPTTIAPEPDDRRENAAIWRGGETDFVTGEPRVVLAAGGAGPSPAVLAAVAALVVGLGVAGAWWYRTRASGDRPTEPGSPEGDVADGTPRETGRDPEAGPAAADESGAASGPGTPDPDLLSNEEQVLRIVEAHGGRVKQRTVADELDWTDAKTSKVVGGLRDDGELESFRLGRENVLSLPGESILEGDASEDGGDGSS